MSPLACSLFVLAALLATAHGYCSTKYVGRRTNNEVPYGPVEFILPAALFGWPSILGKCPPDTHYAGADFVACNNDPLGVAPDLDGPPPGKLVPIKIWCAKVNCPSGAFFQATLHCADDDSKRV